MRVEVFSTSAEGTCFPIFRTEAKNIIIYSNEMFEKFIFKKIHFYHFILYINIFC